MSDGLRLAAGARGPAAARPGASALAVALARVARSRRTGRGIGAPRARGRASRCGARHCGRLGSDRRGSSPSCWSAPSPRGVAAAFAVPVAGVIATPRAAGTGARALARPGEPRGCRGRHGGEPRRGALADRRRGARAALGARRAGAAGARAATRRPSTARARRAGRRGRPGGRRPVRARRRHLAGRGRARGTATRMRASCSDGLAAVGRSALAGVTARRGAALGAPPRRGASAGSRASSRRSHDSGAVGAALAAELRSRLPIECVGRAPGRGARALVSRARRARAGSSARRGGAGLRRLRARHGGLCAAAPAHARRGAARGSRGRCRRAGARRRRPAQLADRQLAAAQAALVRAAESLAAELHPDRVLQRLAEVVPGRAPRRRGGHLDRRARAGAPARDARPRPSDHAARRGGELARSVPAGAAISGGRPVVELHEADDPAVHRALDAVRRELAVPLRLGGRVRGALVISSLRRAPRLLRRRRRARARPSRGSRRSPSRPLRPTTSAARRPASTARPRELTAELAMARNSDGLRESLARVARQTLGADAARVRLGGRARGRSGEHRRGAHRRSSCWRCASAASSPRAASAATPACRPRSVAACPGAAPAGACRSRTTGARAAAGVVDAAVAAHARVRRRRRGARRAPARGGGRRRRARRSSRRPSGARARPPASCSASARCSRPTSTRARCCEQIVGAGRQPAGRRRVRPAPAGGGRARAARRRGRARREPRRRAPLRQRRARGRGARDLAGRSRSTTSPPTGGCAPSDPVLERGLRELGRRADRERRRRRAGHARDLRPPAAAPARRRGRGARRVRELGVGRAPQRAPLRGGREREGARRRDPRPRSPTRIVATDAEGRDRALERRRRAITQIPERRALGRVLAELLTSELGDADGSAHGALARRRRDRRPRCGSRAAGAGAVALGHGRRHERRRRPAGPRAAPCATSPRCARSSSSRATSWPPSRTSCARR